MVICLALTVGEGTGVLSGTVYIWRGNMYAIDRTDWVLFVAVVVVVAIDVV